MPPCSDRFRRARPLLGTLVEVQIGGLPIAQGLGAIEQAFAAIAEVQREMSFHDSASLLSELNRDAFQRPVRVSEAMAEVLRAAGDLFARSAGVFDVCMAPWLEQKGFLPTAPERPPLEKVASFASVELSADRWVRFDRPEVRIDLGGIAKGFAVDQAIGALQRAGVPFGMVNAGGDLRVFGREGFPVAIRDPRDPLATLTTLSVCERALATSAHYFADRLVPGETFGPIVNPSSGQPATGVLSASVQAPTALIADPLTKILMLAPDQALPLLAHFQADALFVAIDGRASCSAGWNATFEFSS